jgi:hypothetical protein
MSYGLFFGSAAADHEKERQYGSQTVHRHPWVESGR